MASIPARPQLLDLVVVGPLLAVASNVREHPRAMVRHRISYALALAALLVLGQGGVALADANAWWTPAFNDPARVDISDIGGLIAETVLYSNPMDDLCRGLLVLLRPTGRVVLASASAIDELSPRAHRPRAPPAV